MSQENQRDAQENQRDAQENQRDAQENQRDAQETMRNLLVDQFPKAPTIIGTLASSDRLSDKGLVLYSCRRSVYRHS
jgi:hypothetical protein